MSLPISTAPLCSNLFSNPENHFSARCHARGLVSTALACEENLRLSSLLTGLEGCVEEVELFQINVEAERHFSHGVWKGRQHVILRLGAGGVSGWGECVGATNTPDFEVKTWGAALGKLKNCAWSEVAPLLEASRSIWPVKQLEMTEMAVLDLAGKLRGQSALEMLGLQGRAPVAGLFCILESDPQRAVERARFARQNGLKTHAKLKIFGQSELDCALISAVRSEMGPNAYLTADANGGYKSRGAELVGDLRKLRAASLDACEDPAKLSVEAWVETQSAVGDLALIPDAPLRPAWTAKNTILPGMGRIYNIHPGTAGSLLEAVALARKIQSFDAALMVGDDSLIGPACTAWQQMAIGLGAAWVEALEKSDESDTFLKCVQNQSTRQNAEGDFEIDRLRPGFGLEVDAAKLRAECAAVWSCEAGQ